MSDTRKPTYTLKPVTTSSALHPEANESPQPSDPFIRPAVEDDDGYDPFSDRPPTPEPTFEEDPWK